MSTPTRIPLVDYLVLDNESPHLVANECTNCGARFFDRRNACAGCYRNDFHVVPIDTEGELRAYTIVSFAAPHVEVPFIAGLVDCAGTSVKGNIINCAPDPDHVSVGMRVRLVTYSLGTDEQGVEAVGFGFEPVRNVINEGNLE